MPPSCIGKPAIWADFRNLCHRGFHQGAACACSRGKRAILCRLGAWPQARRSGLLDAPTAWLFGNEARGLTDENLALADAAIVVPIYVHAESMNLATAASVCLYESAFAQH